MIGKHVDFFAIGVLLCGIAIYSNAREFVAFEYHPPKRVAFLPREHRSIVVPRITKLCFARD